MDNQFKRSFFDINSGTYKNSSKRWKTPVPNITFDGTPTYPEFKKVWSKATGISSFFGSDKEAFLEDWNVEKRSALIEKRTILEKKLIKDFENKLPKTKSGYPTAKSRGLIEKYEKDAFRIAREKIPIKF
jgi:hypothetical protein